MFTDILTHGLEFDSAQIERRVRARITLPEFFGLSFAVGMVVALVWLSPRALHYDLENYLNTTYGDYSYYYYGYWLVPIFQVLGRLPLTLVYVFWSMASIVAVFLAARIFGGSAPLALISFQMIYVLFQGQITGLLIGGSALLWWGMAQRRWDWAGLGLLVAATKYQTGLALGLFLWLLAPLTWRERLRVLVIPVGLVLLSLVVYPLWFLDVWRTIQSNPPDASASIALWQWIGPVVLVFWIPPLVLPLARTRRLILLVATTALGLPYFQQADLLALFALPVGWIPLLGNLGYFHLAFGEWDLRVLFLVPLLVYLVIVAMAVWDIFKAGRK